MTCQGAGVAVDLTGSFGGTSDHRLADLKSRSPALTALRIHHSRITDKGFRHLKDLTALERLTIGIHPNMVPKNSLGDEALRHLVGLKELECLSLTAQRATEKGLVHLKQLPKLKRLNLNLYSEGEHSDRKLARKSDLEGHRRPTLSDKALSHLGDLKQLEHLNLADYTFPNNGLRHLARLENLKFLSLAFTDVDDDALMHLSQLKKLEILDLRETPTTRKGLAPFSRLKKLRIVGFSKVK